MRKAGNSLKKTAAAVLAGILAAGMAGCGGSGQAAETTAASTAAETTAASSAAESTEAASSEAESTKAESASSGEKTELIVFAAASMTETMNQIKDLYEAANPDITITYNFDSSGTLQKQIQEGADCDLFVSASPKQMNALDAAADETANPDKVDIVDHDTRADLLENKVTLAVPDGNPKKIESFDALADLLKSGDVLLAMGNSDVPVGQYTQKILAYYGLDEEALAKEGKITYGSNVKEVTTQVKEASVDCGVIYATDAFSAGLETVDSATKEMCGQVIYPAAVLKTAAHPEEAKAFLTYLEGSEAGEIFESVGFTALN